MGADFSPLNLERIAIALQFRLSIDYVVLDQCLCNQNMHREAYSTIGNARITRQCQHREAMLHIFFINNTNLKNSARFLPKN